jgi:tetratricopeptide (TPR) repeat protein
MTIKVKTLVFVLLMFLALAALAVFVALPAFWYEKGMYERVLSFPNGRQADALVQMILQAEPTTDDDLYITPNGYSRVQAANPEGTLERALVYARKMLAEYPKHRWSQEHGEWTIAHIYRNLGDFAQAREWFEKAAAKNNMHREEAAQMAEALTPRFDPDKTPAVEGRVWIGRELAKQVIVYLQPKEANSWHSPPFGVYPVTVPDAAGVFRFYGIAPGNYEIGVGIDAGEAEGFVRRQEARDYVTVKERETGVFDVRFVPQAKVVSPVNGETISGGRLRFEWEPYPGADYYQLKISRLLFNEQGNIESMNTVFLEERWRQTEAEYDISDLRTLSPVISYDSEGLLPGSVLGIVYPGGTFTWAVDAYDQNDIRIGSSGGYYAFDAGKIPVFSLDDEQSLSGDEFVLQRQWDKAVAAYEKDLPNPYALRALAAIYLYVDEKKQNGGELKALEYLRQLADPSEYERELMERIAKGEQT